MKTVLAIIVCIAVLSFAFLGCGTPSNQNAVTTTEQTMTTAPPATTEAATSAEVTTTVGTTAVAAAATTTAATTAAVAETTAQAPQTELIQSSYGGIPVTPAGVLPVVVEPVTLTIMVEDHANVEDYYDNKMTRFMQEQTGVTINWMLTPQADSIQKVNLILASQVDIPDVFMIPSGITNDMIADMADQGVFLRLDDMIESLGYWYKEVRAKDPLIEQIMKLPDGSEYSLPKVVLSEPNATSRRAWINQNWLDALGLQKPTTTDELTEILRAFKSGDPNGNGINDEIAFMGSTNGWATNPEEFILNSFVKYNRGNPWYLDNGKFTAAIDKDAYRKGLIYMNMLVREGLLDPASYTQDDDQLRQLFNNDDIALVGLAVGGGTFLWASMDSERVREYEPLSPLKGPDGIQYSYYDPYGSYSVREWIITSACKNPEVAFRFADYMYTREASMRNRLGEPGVDYIIPTGNEMGVDGKPATYIPVLQWGSVNSSHWNEIGPTYNDFDNNGVKGDDPYELQQYLWNATKDFYTPYLPPMDMNYNGTMFFEPDDARKLADIWGTLRDYNRSALAEFVTGVRNPENDGDWERYIDDITKIGYLDYIDIVQKRYD